LAKQELLIRKHAGCAPSEYSQQFCWLLREKILGGMIGK
jgi:hypothetical protein